MNKKEKETLDKHIEAKGNLRGETGGKWQHANVHGQDTHELPEGVCESVLLQSQDRPV